MKKYFLLPLFICLFGTVNAQDWAEDVSCILYTHCANCHNPNGIAPFSLITYNDAYNLRSLIQTAVVSGSMPPWPADPNFQQHAHERLLTAAEIATIDDWVNNGAPEGNPTLAPPAPFFASTEVIDNPDLVIAIDPYTSQAFSSDDYRCFVIDNPFSTDKYITGFEVIPGNRSIVHHVLMFIDDSNTPYDNEASNPDPGYVCFGGANSNSAKLVAGWAPGQEPTFYPSGMGVKITSSTNFVIQVHYPQGSGSQVDAGTKLNVELSDTPQRNVSNQFVLNHYSSLTNGPLVIPANTTKTFYSEYTTPAKLTVLDVFPHMHLIGRSIKSWAVTPGGQTINFVDIPEWSFHWQGYYAFRQPIVLPAGTTIYGEAYYDNTSANPHNPSDPPQTVGAGEATTDEMMLVAFSYLLYQAGDENIIVDDGAHVIEYCDTVSTPNLSIELLHFEGFAENRVNKLSWKTAFEENLLTFEVERSENQVSYEKMASVKAKGSPLEATSYRFVDRFPVNCTNYYRLKIIESDGKFSYTQSIAVKNCRENELVIFPNPAKDQLYVEKPGSLIQSAELFDAAGRQMILQAPENDKNYIEMNTQILTSGIYFLKIKFENGSVEIKKVMVE